MDKLPEYSRADMITAVRHAIYIIATTGQSYKIGSKSLTRADLSDLRGYLKELESQPDENRDFFSNFSLSKHIRR